MVVSISGNGSDGVPADVREFATTHWSVVLAANGSSDSQASVALETLCRTYWYPLYAYVRRQGRTAEESQDLTQEFFLRLLQKNRLAMADPSRGRFRSFLLTSLKNFLVNHWEKTQTMKRGSGQPVLSWDAEQAEGRYLAEPVNQSTPDRIYEKRWAVALVENVLEQLRTEYASTGKLALFDDLKAHVWGDGGEGYAAAAARLNTTEGALRLSVHRMREQFRRLLRQEVAHTVAEPEEIDAELRHLIAVLRD